MTGLGQVRAAVIETLKAAGLEAAAAYDGRAKDYAGPVAAVAVAEISSRPAAMLDYLGQGYDEARGIVVERYGRTLEVAVSLDIRAGSAAACQQGCETAWDALLSGALPAGLRLGEQSWEAVSWDRANQCFLRRGRAVCRAFFTATAAEDADEVTDFILKGVLRT